MEKPTLLDLVYAYLYGIGDFDKLHEEYNNNKH